MMAVVQSLNLVVFAWFNRLAGLWILVLRQQQREPETAKVTEGRVSPATRIPAMLKEDV